MARVTSPLRRELTRGLPLPATVRLNDHDGIIGIITSIQFAGMEALDRQDLIGEIAATSLSPEERRRVLVIVGVTPDEGTGYLASED